MEFAFLALALPCSITLLLQASNLRRLLLVGVILLFTARYLSWRIGNFPFGSFYESVGGWWMALVLLVEVLAILEYFQFLTTITCLTDRRHQADQAEAALRQRFDREGESAIPSIDVLIPTYNEDQDVVGKTILGALQLDYPRFEVYVLDDGQRDWLRTFCAQVGVHYITRPDRKGAKAGNINHALNVIQGDLNLLLDADFIPYRNCLWRLAGLFDDPRIATVQTPQNFYNPDAIQHNINISTSWGCEQEFFFQVIMPGRDAVGGAFCCGSCCMHRTAALRSVGGFPTSSITEDILLTVALVKRGWKTIYLREATTMGLAAENLSSFFIQRQRWGRGNIQVGYQVAQDKELSLKNKLLFFPFYWMIQHGSRAFFQLIPIVFFLSGIGPIPASETQEILDFQLPFVLAVMTSMFVLMRPYYLPLFTEAISLFNAFALLPELIQSLVRPYTKGFSVTPKGNRDSSTDFTPFQPTLWPAAVLLSVNILVLLKILLGLTAAGDVVGWELAVYATLWCGFNIGMLVICILTSLERPQPRREHRLLINQPARLQFSDGSGQDVQLMDLSMSGAKLQAPAGGNGLNLASATELIVDATITVPLQRCGRGRDGAVIAEFAALPLHCEQQLVGYAFSGAFSSAEQPQQILMRSTIQQLWKVVKA